MLPLLRESEEITLAAYFLDRTTSNQAELPAHATHHTHTATLEGAKHGNAEVKKGRMGRERKYNIAVTLPE